MRFVFSGKGGSAASSSSMRFAFSLPSTSEIFSCGADDIAGNDTGASDSTRAARLSTMKKEQGGTHTMYQYWVFQHTRS
eukprot:525170-Pelagomonas_calceolata.AAC.5